MARRADLPRAGAIGVSHPRSDAADKASGAARYPQDVAVPPGCLHVATVRAPIARAMLRGVDVAPARAVPGVVASLPQGTCEAPIDSDCSRPTRKCSSPTASAGRPTWWRWWLRGRKPPRGRARARSRWTWWPRRRCSTRSGHAILPRRSCTPERAATWSHPNIVSEQAIVRGKVDDALRRAAVVVEAEYRTDFVEHAFLAPEAGIALPGADGRLTLLVATQWPQEDLRQAAEALGEPIGSLRIVQQAIGGAFGAREDISLQILLLLAARHMQAPVRMVWDRVESIRGHSKRHPFRIRHVLGADERGMLVAARIDMLADAGCYASSSAAVIANALSQACGPYAIAHVHLVGRAVYTNNPYTGAFRGFGVNQATFAMEQQVNKLAHALGIAPSLVRRRNFVREGGQLGTGARVFACGGLSRTVSAATTSARRRRLPRAHGQWRYGRGMASALKNIGFSFGFDDRATARVTVTRRDATVWVAASEVGQGTETVLAQIAAQALGLPPRAVRIAWHDTDEAPGAGRASASHQTFVSGNAIRIACEEARKAIAARGGRGRLPPEGVSAVSTFQAPSTDPLTSAAPTRHAYSYAWSACVADVGVDLETGRVRVLRVVNALDAGRVINPKLLEGQVEGGVVMGQGYALQERLPVRDGMPLGAGFAACNLPTAVDAVPVIETIALEGAEPGGPYGARGIGEITMIPVVPAILAAIHAASGVWVDHLPALPERVLAALDR